MLIGNFSTLHPYRLVYLGISLLLFTLPGCSFLPKFIADIETETIEVSAAPNANAGYPIAVDVVVLNDTTLVQAVQEMSAKDWFAGREQFILDHREMSAVIKREVVPGRKAPEIELERSIRVKAAAVFAFANYLNEGAHRVRLDDFEKPKLLLSQTTLKLVSK